jgi:hypothetical protein
MAPASTAARFLTYSAAGWGIERAWRREPPRSAFWDGQDVPLLPIYGAGALLAIVLHEHMDGMSLPLRFASYATALTGFEWLSCKIGREVYGWVGWSYPPDGACVDMPHALAWGLLGVLLEKADPAIFG